MRISGYIFSCLLALTFIRPAQGQDTIRTYGPEIGLDVSRLVYLFSSPPQYGAGASLTLGVSENLYPVIELGYNRMNDSVEQTTYASGGIYGRLGIDYNILPVEDPGFHHRVTFGLRYATSRFSHEAKNIRIPGEYWGDYLIDEYQNTLQAHWLELVAGVHAELLPNFFMGWTLRFNILLNKEMDPLLTPLMIPGYGKGTENRALGFTYTIAYRIPIIKK